MGVVVVVVVVVNIVLVTGNTGQAAEPGDQSAEPLSHQNSAWCQMPNSAERWPLIAHNSEIIDPLRPAPFGFCLFGVIAIVAPSPLGSLIGSRAALQIFQLAIIPNRAASALGK